MINERLCEKTRQLLFDASTKHFDFLNCETETSKRFKSGRKAFRF